MLLESDEEGFLKRKEGLVVSRYDETALTTPLHVFYGFLGVFKQPSTGPHQFSSTEHGTCS